MALVRFASATAARQAGLVLPADVDEPPATPWPGNAVLDALEATLPVWRPCPSWQAHQWQPQGRGQCCTACGVFWGTDLLPETDNHDTG